MGIYPEVFMDAKEEVSKQKLQEIADRLARKKPVADQNPFVSPQVAGQFLGILIRSIEQANEGQEDEQFCPAFIACVEKFYTELEKLTDEFETHKDKPKDELDNLGKYYFENRYYYLKRGALRELDQLASNTSSSNYLGLCFLFAFGMGLTSALCLELLPIIVMAIILAAGGVIMPPVGAIILGGFAAMAFLSGVMTAGIVLAHNEPIAGAALNSCLGINTFGFLKDPVKKFVQHTDTIETMIKQDSEELKSLPTSQM